MEQDLKRWIKHQIVKYLFKQELEYIEYCIAELDEEHFKGLNSNKQSFTVGNMYGMYRTMMLFLNKPMEPNSLAIIRSKEIFHDH